MEKANTRSKAIMLIIARFLDALSLLFLILMTAAHIIGTDVEQGEVSLGYSDLIMMLFFPFGTMAGLIISWFKGKIGGYMIIVAIAIFHIIDIIRGGNTDFIFFIDINNFIDINALIGLLLVISTNKRR